ncbi:MAG: DUF2461 domain-containing protein [Flavobacterium sp.]|nr:MAG: DUF2461 domain-containing protein [Flavobacterium sp.]
MPTHESLKFLSDLSQNNHREWFQANQDCYAEYKKDYKNVAEAFITEMALRDESLRHLEFKDCSFRINRDIRFSKDKRPYKNNMAIWLSAGSKKTNLAGYYIHIENSAGFLAGGVYWPEAADLKKIRREIDGFYEDLEEILADKEFKKIFGKLDSDENNTLKSSPKDYDKTHPAIEFLKLKSFTASTSLEGVDVTSENFVKEASKKLIVLKPLIEFLNRALTTE